MLPSVTLGVFEPLLLYRIGGVGKELSKEDLLVGVERLCDDVEQLLGFSLEFHRLHVLLLDMFGVDGAESAGKRSGRVQHASERTLVLGEVAQRLTSRPHELKSVVHGEGWTEG